MKTRQVFIGLLLALALLFTNIAVTGDGPNDPMGRDGGHGPGMPDDSRMEMPHRPMVGRQGYIGMGENMIIEGNVTVDDAINITLSVRPSTEMEDMMRGRGMEEMHQNMEHTMSVLITELVEYKDELGDGYTEDDTVISTLKLNSTNLTPVEFVNESGIVTYRTSTLDNVTFSLILEVNTTSNLPNEWKWSYDINYPFTDSSSKLAVLHEIHSFQGSLVADQHRMDRIARFTHMNNSKVIANHSMLPMLFTWDRTANIDGTETEVVATGSNGTIALSFEQGNSIYYDPKLTIDEEVIQGFDQNLATLFSQEGLKEFAQVLGLPNEFALIIASIVVILTLAIGIWKKK